MTTILYKHSTRELACDSQTSRKTRVMSESANKLYSMFGAVVAMAGPLGDCLELISALRDAKLTNKRVHVNSQAICIVLPDEGDAYTYAIDNHGILRKVAITEDCAFGSGEMLALGALAVGATAKQAIEAAIKYDLESGGEAIVVSQPGRL